MYPNRAKWSSSSCTLRRSTRAEQPKTARHYSCLFDQYHKARIVESEQDWRISTCSRPRSNPPAPLKRLATFIAWHKSRRVHNAFLCKIERRGCIIITQSHPGARNLHGFRIQSGQILRLRENPTGTRNLPHANVNGVLLISSKDCHSY